jgi:hypothetical protein
VPAVRGRHRRGGAGAGPGPRHGEGPGRSPPAGCHRRCGRPPSRWPGGAGDRGAVPAPRSRERPRSRRRRSRCGGGSRPSARSRPGVRPSTAVRGLRPECRGRRHVGAGDGARDGRAGAGRERRSPVFVDGPQTRRRGCGGRRAGSPVRPGEGSYGRGPGSGRGDRTGRAAGDGSTVRRPPGSVYSSPGPASEGNRAGGASRAKKVLARVIARSSSRTCPGREPLPSRTPPNRIRR